MPIATLFDDKEEDSEDDTQRELYTGGADGRGGGSGMAVLGPPGDDDPDADAVTRMFRQAQRNAQGADGADASVDGADKVTVVVYANGFVVGDGAFRPADDNAENEAFLRDVGRGIVPRELEDRAGAGAVNLELVDKRGETYEAPDYVAFSGGGQTLASAAATTGVFAAATCAVKTLDDAQPKTTMQVRLTNGTRARVTLNLDATVAQLDALLRADHGATGSYQLLAGFPPSALADPAASIEAAGLKGASVTQKAA